MRAKILVYALSALILATIHLAEAQQPKKVFRIGFLETSTASGIAVYVAAFQQELRKLGWIDGQNITIEYRFGEQKLERLPELAAELVRLKVDVIVGATTTSALAAKSATTTIPIVMGNVSDPVTTGLIASLAQPGGNVTGLSSLNTELNTKRLEILKDAVPKLARVGLLFGADSVSVELQLKELRPAASALKLKLEEIETQPDPKALESRSTRLCRSPLGVFSPKESGSWSLPAKTGCRPFMHRRSLSMRGASCPTERIMLISIGERLFTWTKF
jgi:putative tryptophan/tyrosine transport system substrate-binding protein